MIRNDGQNQRRRMFRVVENDVRSRLEWLLRIYVFAGFQIAIPPSVQVTVKAWEVAAGNFQTYYVPFLENIAGRPHVNIEFVYLGGRNQRWRFLRVAIGDAKDSFG
jgi:hypothetical protein